MAAGQMGTRDFLEKIGLRAGMKDEIAHATAPSKSMIVSSAGTAKPPLARAS